MGAVAIYALAALLACVCLTAVAIPVEPPTEKPTEKPTIRRSVHIPNGKVYVYKYSAVVSAGQDEPAPFVSKVQIQGKLLHKHDSSDDPDLTSKEVKYMKFDDIKHSIFNGPNSEELHGEYHSLDKDIKDIEEPILVIYDDYNRLQGVKIQDSEATWSRNMKKSLASIMQMDFENFELQENMQPQAFETREKTIHGECLVQYSVYTETKNGEKLYYVRKTYEPKSCSKYVLHGVSDAKKMDCNTDMEQDLVTSAERIYEFEFVDNKDFLVRKIVTHEKLIYLPWQHRSPGIQYITTNQTIKFEKVVNESELKLPNVDFKKVQVDDVTFEYEQSDSEFSRHDLGQKFVKEKTQEFLVQTMDFIKNEQLESKYAVEKLQRISKFLDSESLSYIYKHFNQNSAKGNMTRKIFLEIVPHAGTYAAWNFTKQLLSEKEIDEATAVQMLSVLPLYINKPTEKFAKEMSDFKYFDLSKSVKKASILAYSILLHKTYKNVGQDIPEYLESEIKYFYERVKYEATYMSKIVYIMALKNIEVGNIYKYLAPIVRGEDIFFVKVDIEKPEKYRMAAMWAVAKSISHDKDLTFNLFWPILSNKTESFSMRMTAYELLVSRNPMLDMNLLMNVHWLMSEEQDEHLFNYHYTTMKNMAESTNPCMKSISEMMRKILRLTKRRDILNTLISLSNVYDYYDTKYGHGKSFKVAFGIDEKFMSHIGYYEVISTFARKPRHGFGFHWNLDGISFNTIMEFFFSEHKNDIKISDKKIQDLIRQTYSYKLFNGKIHVEYWKVNKGYVTDVQVFFENGLAEFISQSIRDFSADKMQESGQEINQDFLDIDFTNRYKMIVSTDIGMPAIFYNEVPYLSSLKIKSSISPYMKMHLQLEMRYYMNSIYKMKFYNPFADVTHSVFRSVTTDVILPVDMTFTWEILSMKIILPRMPETKMSTASMKRYAVDQTQIGNDYKNTLKSHCSTCKHYVEITKDKNFKTDYEIVKHSMDLGLEYKYTVFNCDDRYISNTENEEWFRILTMTPNNAEKNIGFDFIMAADMALTNFLNFPYTSNCGTIVKISPSTVYPASRMEINALFTAETLPGGIRLNIRNSIHTNSVSTNKTMRRWEVNMKTDIYEFLRTFNMQLTRYTPGEENLKICFDVKKEFPNLMANDVKIKPETLTETTFTMGYSPLDDGKCIQDSTSITATIRGEILPEQEENTKKYVDSGSCFKNPSNPLVWDVTKRFDWNCIYNAIESTTVRKYTIEVLYKQVPHEMIADFAAFDDFLRHDVLPTISYRADHTNEGNITILYTQLSDIANVTVINPYYTYEYTMKKKEDEDLILDNTAYSFHFLNSFYSGNIRPCIAHPTDMINDLNQTVPMIFKDWTLMYGDYNYMSFAIFVKTIDDKIAMKIYSRENILEVQPGKSKSVYTFDGTMLDNDQLQLLEEKSWLKASMAYDILNIDIEKYIKMKIIYTPYNVVIMPQKDLSNHFDGTCGHIGSTVYTQAPLVCNSC